MNTRTGARIACHGHDDGFTLVELLIVVIVLGVLAAIVIPFYYMGQQNSRDAGAKSDLEHSKTAVVSYWTTKGSSAAKPTFDADATTGLGRYGYTKSPGSTSTVGFAAGSTPAIKDFCIEVTGVTGNTFHVTESSAVLAGGC